MRVIPISSNMQISLGASRYFIIVMGSINYWTLSIILQETIIYNILLVLIVTGDDLSNILITPQTYIHLTGSLVSPLLRRFPNCSLEVHSLSTDCLSTYRRIPYQTNFFTTWLFAYPRQHDDHALKHSPQSPIPSPTFSHIRPSSQQFNHPRSVIRISPSQKCNSSSISGSEYPCYTHQRFSFYAKATIWKTQ